MVFKAIELMALLDKKIELSENLSGRIDQMKRYEKMIKQALAKGQWEIY